MLLPVLVFSLFSLYMTVLPPDMVMSLDSSRRSQCLHLVWIKINLASIVSIQHCSWVYQNMQKQGSRNLASIALHWPLLHNDKWLTDVSSWDKTHFVKLWRLPCCYPMLLTVQRRNTMWQHETLRTKSIQSAHHHHHTLLVIHKWCLRLLLYQSILCFFLMKILLSTPLKWCIL